MKEVVGLKTPLSNNFTNNVTGAIPQQDYNLTIENFPEKKKTLYTYNFNPSFNPSNKQINIELLNNGLFDLNRNALTKSNWSFPIDVNNQGLFG